MIHSNITPFGQTLLLWRRERGLTQEELARRSRITRPNLSAIERGRREVSLGTLRALALSLNVRPGVLVDGVAPHARRGKSGKLSRESLERIADAASTGAPVRHEHERILAGVLRQLVRHRASAAKKRWTPLRSGKRAAAAAWLLLESSYPPAVAQSLIRRVAERQSES